MKGFFANPIYVVPAVLLLGFGSYYLYGAIDRVGLEAQSVEAVVTSKEYTPGGTTYRTVIAANRAWTQAIETGDWYAIQLRVGTELTVGLVSKEAFERLNENDRVQVKVRRTRLSGKLEVIEVGAHAQER